MPVQQRVRNRARRGCGCPLLQTSAAVCAEAEELPPLLVELLVASPLPFSWGAGHGQVISSRQVAHYCVYSV